MLVDRKTHLITGKVNTMDLPVTQAQMDLYILREYWYGRIVQDIFPDLDVDQREFLISGYVCLESYDNSMQFLAEER